MDSSDLSAPAQGWDGREGCAVVSPAGRADIVDWFTELLERPEAQEPESIIFDLSGLSSIDWWPALVLLWAGRVVSSHGGTLVLASPQPAVARLLKAVGAAQEVAVYRSVQQARNHRLRPAAQVSAGRRRP